MKVLDDLTVHKDADKERGAELDSENGQSIHFLRFSGPIFYTMVYSISLKKLNIKNRIINQNLLPKAQPH